MRKICLTAFVTILTLLLASCSGGNESETTTQTTQPNNSNVSENTSETKREDNKEQATENKQPEEKETANRNIPGLIPPTNPDRRRREISEGRRDPFALIPLKSDPTVKQEPTTAEDDQNKQITAEDDQNKQTTTQTADLAEEVVVKGVIKVSGNTKIILKAPNEQFTRYVRLGQYISNGQVLVKGVRFNFDPPIVVLEQSGIEVLKQVGQEV